MCSPRRASGVPLTIGYSSLGLPLWNASEREREAVLDLVFSDQGHSLLELHLESTSVYPRSEQAHLAPPLLDAALRATLRAIASGVRERGGRLLLGLGGRHLLGPAKHEPSLIHADPGGQALRVQLIVESIELAAELGAIALVFLSGPSLLSSATKHASPEWARLEANLEPLLRRAEAAGVLLAPEAHSSHLLASMADVARLQRRFPSPFLGFTADTAHLTVTEERPIGDSLRSIAPRVTHVQLDNIAALPLRPGAPLQKVALDHPGAVDVPAALSGLIAGGYTRSVGIEFIRHDHPDVEPLAYCRRVTAWLRGALERARKASQHGEL
jgi:sugar phosphate isomerase/epimerase